MSKGMNQYLLAALFCAGSAGVAAETGLQRMQVEIDPRTGAKAIGADATKTKPAAKIAATSPIASMKAKSGPMLQGKDGKKHARLGLDSMQFLVVRIDENGNKIIEHRRDASGLAPREKHDEK